MLELFDFQSRFISNMESHELWLHPYFQLVRERPSFELLQQWAIQAGMIDEIFAEILQSLVANPLIPRFAHQEIIENLNDELGNGNLAQEHFDLALRNSHERRLSLIFTSSRHTERSVAKALHERRVTPK